MKCPSCRAKYCEDCGIQIIEKSNSDFTWWRIDVDGTKTTQQVYDECAKLFPCWKWTDKSLDEVIASDERTSTYSILVRYRVEADEEYKNMSDNDIKEKGIKAVTLKERLLMEIDYFKRTGKHLDIDNWTLCAGSRDSDGYVPSVSWDDDKLDVDWYGTGDASDNLRSREAVVSI